MLGDDILICTSPRSKEFPLSTPQGVSPVPFTLISPRSGAASLIHTSHPITSTLRLCACLTSARGMSATMLSAHVGPSPQPTALDMTAKGMTSSTTFSLLPKKNCGREGGEGGK